MRLVIFGPPGAGKGTQAELITSTWGIPHISTGEMLREAVASGTELGLKVKTVLEQGQLVSDELMVSVIEDRLSMPDASTGWLLDGYPRTVAQIATLERVLGDQELDRVICLRVPDSLLMDRLHKRGIDGDHGTKRSDDGDEIVRERLKVYKESTAPVAGVYREQGVLAEIDGTGTIDEVFLRISDIIEELRG